jgi:rubrerythrin
LSAFDGQAKRDRGSALSAAVAAAVAVAALAVALLLGGCGGGDGGGGTTTADEKAADVELLNAAIGQELGTIDAYEFGLPLLHGEAAAAARQMRGQAQEHVDGMTKAIRGLGGAVEAEADELDLSEVKDQTGFLAFAYELEAAAVAAYNDTVVGLQTSAPRRVTASIAANKAQHLVILRQLLGAGLLESFPEAFDGGQVPPPGSPPEDGG